MPKTISFATLAAASFALAACGGADSQEDVLTTNELTELDPMAETMAADADMTALTAQDYVAQAAAADMFVIDSARLAANNAENPQVKDFARTMIADHTKASNELKTLAASMQPQLTIPSALPSEMQMQLDQLKDANGAAFDQMYLSQQIPAHQRALNLHRAYAQNGAEAQLKSFAEGTANVVQGHLTMAEQLAR